MSDDDESKMSKIESVIALSQFDSHSILQDGLATLESITSGGSFNDGERDARFSYSLSANLHEAIEFSVETLVSLGHLSIEIDYWIDTPNKLVLNDPFDDQIDQGSKQFTLHNKLLELKELYSNFDDILPSNDPLKSPYVIFLELEKLLCDNGEILTVDWYLARILREFCKKPDEENLFLIGNLWEQLRVKVAHQDEFKKQKQNIDRLKDQSELATKALKEKSERWKKHASLEARRILKDEPWKNGRWSELANAVLDVVELTGAYSELRECYKGKLTKGKPKGSSLISTETVAKFLSKELKK